MSNEKIDQHDFLNLHGIYFSFCMTEHLNPQQPEDESLTAICKMISTAHQNDFPGWARLIGNHYIVQISLQNEVYYCLDPESRDEDLNWLIFKRESSSITVTNFGPFEFGQDNMSQDMVNKTDITLVILRNLLNEFDFLDSEIPEGAEILITPEDIQDEQMAKCWGETNDLELKIESKKMELEGLSDCVYDKPEDRAASRELIGKIKATTGKVLIKALTAAICAEMVEEIVSKIAAKVAAQTASKAAGKTAGKAVPYVGAAVGAGFGIWRLCHGDFTGAGLEFASGAVSCVPGTGTATSLAFDAVLVTKDVIEARNEGNQYLGDMKAEMEGIEMELNDFCLKYGKAKAKYDFVKEILEDEGFESATLQHNIRILYRFLATVHKI